MIVTPDGFVPLGQEGTFLGHVGGLTWRRLADRTDVRVLLEPHHLNPNRTAHGGFLLTVLDITLGATVESYLGVEADRHPVTLQLSASMMAAAKGGEVLFGEARVDRSTRTVTFVSARLHSGGETVLTASAVFRNPPTPPSQGNRLCHGMCRETGVNRMVRRAVGGQDPDSTKHGH
ncbi:MAG: PaaI family thioesterase [Pseudonocardia sp.]|uniref:PaaI family thioesterase n=1 Tax=Pseudonocardia sp. TaxID=60912 RepID=UPI001AD340F1|nr:PaaI family thioesterase [Pseudonocardia sp.]MBN9102410.1 PaaI family thioesterase [Pseudonocardia sp.]